jgi:hypothetical protein
LAALQQLNELVLVHLVALMPCATFDSPSVSDARKLPKTTEGEKKTKVARGSEGNKVADQRGGRKILEEQ